MAKSQVAKAGKEFKMSTAKTKAIAKKQDAKAKQKGKKM